jgi:hypothetical protein
VTASRCSGFSAEREGEGIMERVSDQIFGNNLESRNWAKAQRARRARRVLYSLTMTAGLGIIGVYAICGAAGKKKMQRRYKFQLRDVI